MQSHKQMHLESLNLTLICTIKQGDEWEGVCLAQWDVKNVKMPREIPQSRPTTIYRHPIENIPVGPFSGLSAHAPDVLQGALEASDRLLAAMCPSRLKLSIGAQ